MVFWTKFRSPHTTKLVGAKYEAELSSAAHAAPPPPYTAAGKPAAKSREEREEAVEGKM